MVGICHAVQEEECLIYIWCYDADSILLYSESIKITNNSYSLLISSEEKEVTVTVTVTVMVAEESLTCY